MPTSKHVERIIGSFSWCNLNNRIDCQIWALQVLYRSKKAWSCPKIVWEAKRQMFNGPYFLSQIVNIPQRANILDLTRFLKLDWCHQGFTPSKNDLDEKDGVKTI